MSYFPFDTQTVLSLTINHLSTFTRPNVPQFPDYPEGFQGNNIPLNGAVVAKLAHRRLMLEPDSADDF